MDPSSSSRRPASSNFLSGALGGLLVLIVGGVLIATDVVDTRGTERTIVRDVPAGQPAREGSSEEQSIGALYRREGPGVVLVEGRNVSDNSPFGLPSQRGSSSGSGFVVDREGHILTNAHVVEGSQDVRVRFGSRGEPIEADVKGRDPSSDLAVLKVDPDDAKLNPLPLGDSSKVQVGDPVLAIGNPFGLQFDRTVTSGIVSAIQRSIEAPNGFTITGAIQTDASINPGNSGGPLIDMQGRVIGINSQIATGGSGGGSVGIGFAVPVNLAKQALPKLKRGDRVERAYIGVTSTAINDQIAEDLNLPTDEAAMVVDVRPGSPARKAGLRAGRIETADGLRIGGDLIVRAGGKAVAGPDDLLAAIANRKPGDEIEVEYYRGRDRRKTRLELADRPAGGQAEQESPGLLVP